MIKLCLRPILFLEFCITLIGWTKDQLNSPEFKTKNTEFSGVLQERALFPSYPGPETLATDSPVSDIPAFLCQHPGFLWLRTWVGFRSLSGIHAWDMVGMFHQWGGVGLLL